MPKKNMNLQSGEFSFGTHLASQKLLSILILIVIAFGAWFIFDRKDDIEAIKVTEIAAQQQTGAKTPPANPDETVQRVEAHVHMYGGSVAVATVTDPRALQAKYPGFFQNVQQNDYLLGQDDGSIIVYDAAQDKIRDIIRFKK